MMEKRVGFTLTEAQIEKACEAYVAARLLPDEEANAVVAAVEGGSVQCEIRVSKKRVRKPKSNGAQP